MVFRNIYVSIISTCNARLNVVRKANPSQSSPRSVQLQTQGSGATRKKSKTPNAVSAIVSPLDDAVIAANPVNLSAAVEIIKSSFGHVQERLQSFRVTGSGYSIDSGERAVFENTMADVHRDSLSTPSQVRPQKLDLTMEVVSTKPRPLPDRITYIFRDLFSSSFCS